jgi:acetyl-CoA C-acetyltransferase
VFGQAGVTNPREQIDCIEMYVPFSWYEPMWLENLHFVPEGDGWKMTEKGATALDGELPVNVSGGVLSTNPIGASGMLRFAEAALQVRGQAGEHQVDRPRPRLRRRLPELLSPPRPNRARTRCAWTARTVPPKRVDRPADR